ncbi:MAG TPA: CHRD domain-containing protein [Ktedonobacteraceae bacterium]|nr:CHRD domain-containing protein [Ktedonobacteraceae bacterium]
MKLLKPSLPTYVLMLLSACAVVLLAACGSPPENTGNNSTLTINTTSSTAATTALATVQLKHSPVGTTELSWDKESHKLEVKISLTGLAPNSPHTAHIHAGNCNIDGAVVYPLNTIIADAKGDAISETIINNVQGGIPASGWYVNIHNGTNMASAIEKRPISCANVTNSNSSEEEHGQNITVTMQGTTAPNESAQGTALILKAGAKYQVKITLAGLEPRSTHVAHIHAGSCEAQGPVVTMLNPVVADANGNGTSLTTVDKLPSSPTTGQLYVNVHTGATMAQLGQAVQFNPIACGNLTYEG